MNLRKLVFLSLRHRLRPNLGILLGAAVGTAALVGALVVGDSMRESLRSMAIARLGRVDEAMDAGDRFFRSQLAQEISEDARNNSITTDNSASAAAVLHLAGVASAGNQSLRANHVQVLGVDPSFWKLALMPPPFREIADDSVVLNAALAFRLHVDIGDTLVLRVQKPGVLSRDAVVSPQNDFSVALRLRVSSIVNDWQFGKFSLQPGQTAPFNAYVNLAHLGEATGCTNRANLLLYSHGIDTIGIGETMASQLLEVHWQLADAELDLRTMTEIEGTELRTRRIFLDPVVTEAAMREVTNAAGILTYMVNDIAAPPFHTPYSMVTAATEPLVPSTMKDNEILLNKWLADDLLAKVGDTISMRYYVAGNGRDLEEKQTDFRVFGVVPLWGFYGDKSLMPEFPGIAQAESSSDWDTGFAIDMHRIRPKDEQYWKTYRGTPKAFITLAAGQTLWSNRFGSLTALRFPPVAGTIEELANHLHQQITPKKLGLAFEPIRQQALDAIDKSQDFGGLFVGFSFFLIVAALILVGLLFQFSMEQRAAETGTLLGIGFSPRRIRAMLLMEGAVISMLATVAGIAGGLAYAKIILKGLRTIWRDAVGSSSLIFHASRQSVLIGGIASIIIAMIPIWLTLRHQARQPVRELLAGNPSFVMNGLQPSAQRAKRAKWAASATFILGLILLVVTRVVHRENTAELFFFAAGLFLVSGLMLAAMWLNSAGNSKKIGLVGIALRGCGRRRRRSLATIGLLACGAFLIVSVGAFRQNGNRHAWRRSSGTGGFALVGETAFPITQDLNGKKGREFHSLSEKWMDSVSFVQFRVHAGDEANCLNLNHVRKPRLIGVDPVQLSKRGAFSFAELLRDAVGAATNGWQIIDTSGAVDLSGIEVVPGIADENSILWSMGKKIGDTIDYTDELGRNFKVRLVGVLENSVLQGNIIIGEKAFLRHFPGESGYRFFLMDASVGDVREAYLGLSHALQDVGLELSTTANRLDEYNAVQNTYLNTFQALGGLGLLLGSIGLGIVVLRNVQERRSEIAILQAVGYRRSAIQKLVLMEHSALLLAGLMIGTFAAIVAVLPAIAAGASRFPFLSLGLTLLAVLLNGFLCTWLATKFSLRGNLAASLRDE